MTGISALFLDRDGIIIRDRGFVHRIEQVEFMPGIFELARFAALDLGWPLVVATNQSGIGRGLFSEADYRRLTDWICDRFRAERAPLARVYHCPYHPEHGVGEYRMEHPWRKPGPGMLLQAAADLDLDLPGSALVGDKMSDIEAAAAAGILLRIRVGAPDQPQPPEPAHLVVHTLAEALAALRQHGKPRAKRAPALAIRAADR